MSELKKNLNHQKGAINSWIIFILIVIFWAWFFKAGFVNRFAAVYEQIAKVKQDSFQEKFDEKLIDISLPKEISSHDQCASVFPSHGSKYKYSNQSDAQLHSRLHVNNEHAYSMLLIFYKLDTQQAFGAVLLHPNKSTQVNLPVGNYHMALSTGGVWCNWYKGFVDSTEINVSQEIDVKSNQVINLRLLSFGSQAEDVMISISNSLGLVAGGEQSFQGQGSITLQRVVGGHYVVDGSINRVPATFMIDTGATAVAISESYAKRAGINECRKAKSMTANGLADVCIATARELTLGQFTLKNVEINYGKGMSDDVFLLGMNVIGLFNLEQQGDVMRLSRQ